MEALSGALLELADSGNDAAVNLVERLIASPAENVKRVKARMAALKRAKTFVDWRGGNGFARELEDLLADLKAGVGDPRLGCELVAAFYETDLAVLERCDDSGGEVGMVYDFTAKELFVHYARQCPDKEWLAELVLKLNEHDGYGVRDGLLACAGEYLPEANVRAMIALFQERAATDDQKNGHWLSLATPLARKIKDAPLFEKLMLAYSAMRDRPSGAIPNVHLCTEIARVYAECGDAPAALSWLECIPADETFYQGERDRLLLTIYGMLGDKAKQAEVAWRIFEGHRSAQTLGTLLEQIGAEQREAVIAAAADKILQNKRLKLDDAGFLFAVERLDDAERYLLGHVEQLNGEDYHTLPQFARELEAAKRPLAASMIYRALINSILWRAQSKAYQYGARYWRRLEELAAIISDWRGFTPHAEYAGTVREAHSRKASFWAWLKEMNEMVEETEKGEDDE